MRVLSPGGGGAARGSVYSCGRFSMTWQRILLHREHHPSVRGRPAPPMRMPYFPYGSVKPHLRQRITHPGARRSCCWDGNSFVAMAGIIVGPQCGGKGQEQKGFRAGQSGLV
jgi:hypothetical protein